MILIPAADVSRIGDASGVTAHPPLDIEGEIEEEAEEAEAEAERGGPRGERKSPDMAPDSDTSGREIVKPELPCRLFSPLILPILRTLY